MSTENLSTENIIGSNVIHSNNNARDSKEEEIEGSSELDLMSNRSTVNTDIKLSVSSLPSDCDTNLSENRSSIDNAFEDNKNSRDSKSSESTVDSNEDDKKEIKEDDEIKTVEDEKKSEKVTVDDAHKITNHDKSETITANENRKSINHEPSAIHRQTCEVCQKTVYPMEKLIMDLRVYHKNCFRCDKCKKILSPTVATKINDKLFCKPHYMELFKMRGRYEDIGKNTVIESTTQIDVVYTRRTSSSTMEIPQLSTKDLLAKYQECCNKDQIDKGNERKKPLVMDTTGTNVSAATKNWQCVKDENNDSNSNYRNSDKWELKNFSNNGSVKNLLSRFENRN